MSTSAIPLNQTESDIYESASRLVWVLNNDRNHSYAGHFEGGVVTIPADRQKIPKLFSQGGNLMPYLSARHFITDFKEPQGWEKDRHGKENPIFRTKELYHEELTAEEYARIVKKTPEQLKKEKIADSKRAVKRLNKELNERPNKVELAEDDLS
jgi:hypothetical protein